jgi:hypothetical protein
LPRGEVQNVFVDFNINDLVKVRLTETGRRIHREEHDRLIEAIVGRGGKGPEYSPPREDDEGFCSFQLWSLMKMFGDHLSMSNDRPFDTTIRIHHRN